MKNYYKLWVPEIISVLLFIFSIYFRLDIAYYDYKFICSNCVCFVSIITGSLITMSSIWMTNLNEKYLISLNLLDPDNMIRYYFCSPIISGIVLSIFSVSVGLMIDSILPVSTTNPLLKGMIRMNCVFITSLWLMLTVYFIYSSIRSVFINIEILKILYDSKIGGNNEKVVKNMDKMCEMLNEE